MKKKLKPIVLDKQGNIHEGHHRTKAHMTRYASVIAMMKGEKTPAAVQKRTRELILIDQLTEGIESAVGVQLVIESNYKGDAFNNDNYCRLVDWIKSARDLLEEIKK